MSDDRRLIAAATERLRASVNSSDVAGVMSVWADDGIMMPPNRPPVIGRAALEAFFRALFERAKLNFVFTESEITIDNNIAIERLSYNAGNDQGKGLHVYKRIAGTWKLAIDIWNSNGVS